MAAALHGARRHAGAIGVIGVIRVGAGWIVGVGGVVAGAEEIGRHLPHIADHVVEAVRVGLVTADRRDALGAVGFGIVVGKSALPAVRLRRLDRSEERRVGEEGVRQGRPWWWAD